MTTAMGVALRNRIAPLESGRHVVWWGSPTILVLCRDPLRVQRPGLRRSLDSLRPRNGRVLCAAARGGGAAASDVEARQIASVRFKAGPPPPLKARFGAGFWGSVPPENDEELQRPFAESACLPPSRWPRFEWKDESDDEKSALLGRHGAAWIVEEEDDDSHLVTVLSDGTGAVRTWNTLWVAEAGHDERSLHRIRVKTRGPLGRLLCSEPFSLDAIRTGAVPLPLPAASSCP